MSLPCFWICWDKKRVKANYVAILNKEASKKKKRQEVLREENERLLKTNKQLRQKIEETQPPGYHCENPPPSAPTAAPSPKRQVMEGEGMTG